MTEGDERRRPFAPIVIRHRAREGRPGRPLEVINVLRHPVLTTSDHWHLADGRVYGKLYAHGRVYVAADGPAAFAEQAAEALSRSYRVAEPFVDERHFRWLMACQRVPPSVADAWLRGARVTDDGVYLGWEPPR